MQTKTRTKNSLLFLFILLLSSALWGQDRNVMEEQDSIINQLNKEGKYTDAMELAEKHFEQVKVTYTNKDTSYIKAYGLLATCQYYTQQLDLATQSFEEIVTLSKDVNTINSIKYKNHQYNLAVIYSDNGRVVEGMEIALEIEDFFEKKGLKTEENYLNVLNLLGNIYKSKQDYEKAIVYYEKAIKGLENIEDKRMKLMLFSTNLAQVYTIKTEYDKAEKILLGAKQFFEEEGKDRKADYSRIVVAIGDLYAKQSQYVDAIREYKHAIKFRKENIGEEHVLFSDIWNRLALCYFYKGDYQNCEYAFLQTKKLNEKYRGKQSSSYGISVGNLGALYWKLNRYEEAENLYLEALAIAKQKHGDTSSVVASTLGNLGLLYGKQKKYRVAEEYYLKTVHLYKILKMDNEPNCMQMVNNLIVLYNTQEIKTIEALALAKANLARRKKHFGTDHPQYAESLGGLGWCYLLLKEYDEIPQIYNEIEEINRNNLGVHHIEYIKNKVNYSRFYLYDKKDIEYARKNLVEVFQSNLYSEKIDLSSIDEDWMESILTKEPISYPLLNDGLVGLTKLIQLEERPDSVFQYYILEQTKLKLLEKSREKYTTENDQLRLLKSTAAYSHKALQLGLLLEADNVLEKEALFVFSEQSKAVLLSKSIQGNNAYQFGNLPKELGQKEKQLQQKLKQLKAKLQQEREDSLKQGIYDEITTVNLSIDSLDTKIEEDYPKYKELRNSVHTTTVAELQKELSEGTALISYLIGDSSTYILYLEHNQFEIFEQKIRYQEIYRNIKSLRKSLSNYQYIFKDREKANQQYVNTAHWFCRKLVAPVLKDKSHIEKLVVIPDRDLAHLPFEAFLKTMPTQGKKDSVDFQNLDYLLNHYRISYHYSARLWAESLKAREGVSNNKMLALASSYESDLLDTAETNPYVAELRKGLNPIPAVMQEVEGLSKHFEGQFLIGKAANEYEFKQEAADYSIIHLAMHGILNTNYPLLSAMAMTESKDSTEDDLLEVHEISGLQLNTDLIVLSACETGFGKFEQGNGVASLARAFMYAGANSMVVSLWQVNDQSTAYLMQQYYQLLANGMDKDEALRAAKMNYISNVGTTMMAHPAFWAPFIQLGNTAPISIATKSNNNWWWIVIGGIALIGLGLFFYSKRPQ